MDALPVRPAPLVRAAPATSRTPRGAGAKGAAATPHPAAAHPAAHPPHAAAHPLPPAGPEDLALIAEQAAFDRMMQQRAELQREANALRDLAMEQVKRDDSVMNAWIKLI
jgi:hypothetical protein